MVGHDVNCFVDLCRFIDFIDFEVRFYFVRLCLIKVWAWKASLADTESSAVWIDSSNSESALPIAMSERSELRITTVRTPNYSCWTTGTDKNSVSKTSVPSSESSCRYLNC